MAPMTDSAATERFSHLSLGERTLRSHTARGTIINAVFMVCLAGVGALRHFAIAIFLTAADYGLWGLIYVAVAALLWLKEVGLQDKYIQQEEADQALAFQKAFTLNLLWTALFCGLIVLAMPLFGLLYGRPEIILPGCVLAVAVLGTAFHAPIWILYRQMRFVRQRSLQAIEPVVGLAATVAMGAAGLSYWSLVLGALAGIWAAAVAAVITCPYAIRFRYDRHALREYVAFSWPVLVSAGSSIVVVQVAVVLGQETAGLAGVGAIGLAGTIAAFADRVDQIVTATLYPAICAVSERTDLLFEAFTKSNRLALIWGIPFGLGLALFAPDLVSYVLGEKWDIATELLQVFGITAAVQQIGFSWPAFQRAIGQTRPLAVYGAAAFVVFFLVGVPAMIAWGLTGYAVAICAITAVQLAVRTYYLKRLFGGFAMVRHCVRAVMPCLPAVAGVLGLRLVETGERSLWAALGELCVFIILTAAATAIAERSLLREIGGYLRGTARAAQAA